MFVTVDHSAAKIEARSFNGEWTWNLCTALPHCKVFELVRIFKRIDHIYRIILQGELVIYKRQNCVFYLR